MLTEQVLKTMLNGYQKQLMKEETTGAELEKLVSKIRLLRQILEISEQSLL